MEYGELFLLERRIINNLITPKGAFKGVETEFFYELLHHTISDEIASVCCVDNDPEEEAEKVESDEVIVDETLDLVDVNDDDIVEDDILDEGDVEISEDE